MKEEYRKIFTKNGKYLKENISFEIHLLTILLEKEVIEDVERKRIEAGEIDVDQTQRLLDILVKKDNSAFSLFCAALREDKQTHVAERLENAKSELALTGNNNKHGTAVDEATFKKWKTILRTKRCEFNDKMRPTNRFLDKLEELRVMNKQTKDRLKAERTDYDTNSALMDYLPTRPKQDFVHFRAALVYDNQPSVEELFDS